jgi:hypothetical protein
MSTKPKARPTTRAKRKDEFADLEKVNPAVADQVRRMVGRPLGEARKGKRYQIGIRVSGQVKSALARRAKENGRSLSSEIEHIIEGFAEHGRLLEVMRTSLAELERTAPDDVLRRKGFTAVPWASGTDAVTAKVWFPPGFPFDKFFGPGWVPGFQEKPK